MLEDPNLKVTYLVIDALDECVTDLPKLLDFIVRISPGRVKWLLSSRNEVLIEGKLKPDVGRTRLSLELKANAIQVSHAIHAYIDDKLSGLASLQDDASLKNQVRDILHQKANGTFLWVALVIQELSKDDVESWHALQIVEELPWPNQIALDDSRSVNSDISDNPTVFSTVGSEYSATTARSLVAHQDAAQVLASALSEDRKLASLYSQAMTKLSKDRFTLNHDLLLKMYLSDLRKEAMNTSDQFRQAIRFLRLQSQREATTLKIWEIFSGPSAPLPPTNQPNQSRVEHKTLKPQGSSQISAPKQDVSTDVDEDEFGDSDGENEKDQPVDPSEQIESLVRLFTEGSALETFKSSFESFLNPPSTVEEALLAKNARVLGRFLRGHFDEVILGYPWVQELRDIGFSNEKIASILLEQKLDSPWIFFKPRDVEAAAIDVNKHIPDCVHRFVDTCDLPANSLSTNDGNSLADSQSIDGQRQMERLVQELCGLAGIAPVSRHQDSWNGSANFLGTENSETLEALISYSSPNETRDTSVLIARTLRALRQLCLALGNVQRAGLCCNSFTMLYKPGGGDQSVIAMKKIHFASIESLYLSLDSIGSFETLKLQRGECHTLATALSDILQPFVGSENWQQADSSTELLHYTALATQALCLAFISYSQGHAGVLELFFLDAPVRKVTLCGASLGVADIHGAIEAQLSNLSCVGDMLDSPVMCFTWVPPGTIPHGHVTNPLLRYDLLASAEDLIDTWGPGKLLLAANGPQILGIHLGGGLISSPIIEHNDFSNFHWCPYGSFKHDTNLREFHPRELIQVATMVTVNCECIRDENEWWDKSRESFHDLGTRVSHWAQAERQVGSQVGVSNAPVLFQANVTWRKFPGRTLKQEKLDPANDTGKLVLFLEDPFGVQVSLCTGVCRRVTIREMLADLLPVFASSSIDPNHRSYWTTLVCTHNILEFLRQEPTSVKDWLLALPSSSLRVYVMKLIRDILIMLKHTGVDPKGKYLLIAWPHETDLDRCFRIPCQGKSSWLGFLADSRDCATFAYITTKCLETGNIKCSGSTTSWGNVVPVLETAVLRFAAVAASELSNTAAVIEHRKVYYFEKMDGLFYVEAERLLGAEPIKLVLCRSLSPSKVGARIKEYVRNEERIWLRERRAREHKFAEEVFVCTRT
ncbi:hypothetical protein QBC40DRAFT_353104 [Triangularia verruculosa]|uniref:NACHT domain-containing protein n=1 Tax=Triangularia verruculosa TaxID=2587418 RepID=A0AAN7AQE3_9PEZI|nr:hypothetical protein QBC40DRAFT_353104 [Triangularia verruculosa]